MKRQKDWTIAYHKQIFDDYGRPAGMSSWVSFYNTQRPPGRGGRTTRRPVDSGACCYAGNPYSLCCSITVRDGRTATRYAA